MISAIKGVHELVQLCQMHGVKHVVVSPGSRNAPLSITLEHAPGIRAYVIPDERSAAFFALGIALALQAPVAIVCTSGSAALNYAPAISEAYYQKIPLIVITADRPQAWINQGDGQTIMQHNVFGSHVLHSVTLPVVEDDESHWLFNRQVNECLVKANGRVKGPVHINIPFKEPLYNTMHANTDVPRKIEVVEMQAQVDPYELEDMAAEISKASKVLVLIGQMLPDAELNDLMDRVQKWPNAIVLTETTSNIVHPNIITTIDRCIDGFAPEEKKQYAPTLLITAGDAIVSKKVKAWLRSAKGMHHWHIGHEHNLPDTYAALNRIVGCTLASFIRQLGDQVNPADTGYRKLWLHRVGELSILHQQFAVAAPWSDFKVFDMLFAHLPLCNIHLGNSSPVRYAQLFDMKKGVKYYGNRGTSGIDGSISTAAGFASVTPALNVMITGDISFYYDSNALWNKYLAGNFRIVLINNKGGNIFRIIEGPSEENITRTYFETYQETDAHHICAQYGVAYHRAGNAEELNALLPAFFKTGDEGTGPAVLEIFTDNVVSPKTLKEYFTYLKS